jgi:hypothetical protein
MSLAGRLCYGGVLPAASGAPGGGLATTPRWASLVAIVLVAGQAVQALTLSASARSTPKKRPAVSFQVGRR